MYCIMALASASFKDALPTGGRVAHNDAGLPTEADEMAEMSSALQGLLHCSICRCMLGTSFVFQGMYCVLHGISIEDSYDKVSGMVACFLVPIRWWWVQGSSPQVEARAGVKRKNSSSSEEVLWSCYTRVYCSVNIYNEGIYVPDEIFGH